MDTIQVHPEEIERIERILLPEGAHFQDDAKAVISCWESTDVSACPGSGKTTVLLAKLKIIADRMPLNDGQGVCVLSHTNVAVNEIKTRLSDCAEKLLAYPNFIGTIQSFIDFFVVKPYLKGLTTAMLQIVDDEVYAIHLYKLICTNSNYSTLRWLIKNNYNEEIYKSRFDFVKKLRIENGALYIGTQRRALAGKTAASTKQFIEAKEELVKSTGMIRYSEAYKYAEKAMKDLSTQYVDLFSRRFKYVFIDEYQDCTKLQRDVLESIFDSKKSCVFHIGDPDQAIYNFDETTEDWKPDEKALPIGMSNRYGQQIADVINNLKTRNGNILSSPGLESCQPTLIVFNDDTRKNVIDTYVSVLEEYGLIKTNGIYKVIGAVKKKELAGLKISDYWEGFEDTGKLNSEYNYWNYIQKIVLSLEKGKGYLVELNIRKLLCRILRLLDKKYTIHTVKEKIERDHCETYKTAILKMFQLESYSVENVDNHVRAMIRKMINNPSSQSDVFDALPKYFMEEIYSSTTDIKHYNTMNVPLKSITIQFDTVHGVKGETHDATLYLETEKNRVSDIKRVLPYFGVGKINPNSDYSRKCVYVGMSRPRKLLCLAIHKNTYENSGKAFESWKVVNC